MCSMDCSSHRENYGLKRRHPMDDACSRTLARMLHSGATTCILSVHLECEASVDYLYGFLSVYVCACAHA